MIEAADHTHIWQVAQRPTGGWSGVAIVRCQTCDLEQPLTELHRTGRIIDLALDEAHGLFSSVPRVPWNATQDEIAAAMDRHPTARELIFDGPQRPKLTEAGPPRHRRRQLPYLLYPAQGFVVGLLVGMGLIVAWALVEVIRDRLGATGLVLGAGLGGALYGLIVGRLRDAPR